ncbi:hypothetical protein C942_04282 [Photobacterium marinum]|uniref:Uncharacterized protein n=1 Tax=Photobacterium marinum TaxID=1056511 RepID=L8JGE2_9GAMM|nr:hypothetical protein [Photobacterium marinum]ELR66584.1 hypothetical protein C942_04282 [Photobacterium marinum]
MIRFIQFLLACSVLAGVGYFILHDVDQAQEEKHEKYQFLSVMYKPESDEYRNLYEFHATLDDVPMPVGTWESQHDPEFHYLLKVNSNGGFVLSINPHANDHSEGAVTGALKITGKAFKAHHVVGTAKHFIPKSGHLVVKSFSDKELQIVHPQSMKPIIFTFVG